jgi:hypothetical protein
LIKKWCQHRSSAVGTSPAVDAKSQKLLDKGQNFVQLAARFFSLVVTECDAGLRAQYV